MSSYVCEGSFLSQESYKKSNFEDLDSQEFQM